MKKNFQKITYGFSVAVVGVILGLSLQLARAWVEPTASAPNGNVGAPINTESGLQTKSGNVGFGGAIANASYGVRSTGLYGVLATGSTFAGYFRGTALTDGSGLYVRGEGTGHDIYAGGLKSYFAGNVGIGTASPAQKLHVEGGAIISGKVGIGATSNSGDLKLDVEGQIGASEYCDENGANCKDIATLGTSGISGSGTTGYVPKWTGATAQGNSIIFDSGTNVGIGTAAPSQKLHVIGNAYVTGNAAFGGSTVNASYGVRSNGTYGVLANGSTFAGYFRGTAATNGSGIYVRGEGTGHDVYAGGLKSYFAGNVGIGTTANSTGLKLDVQGKVGATEYCDENGANCRDLSNWGMDFTCSDQHLDPLSAPYNGGDTTGPTGTAWQTIVNICVHEICTPAGWRFVSASGNGNCLGS